MVASLALLPWVRREGILAERDVQGDAWANRQGAKFAKVLGLGGAAQHDAADALAKLVDVEGNEEAE